MQQKMKDNCNTKVPWSPGSSTKGSSPKKLLVKGLVESKDLDANWHEIQSLMASILSEKIIKYTSVFIIQLDVSKHIVDWINICLTIYKET